jgi:hypothetical protein
MAHSEAKGIKKMLLDNSLFVRLYSPTVEETGRTGGLDSIAAQALTDLRHPFTFLHSLATQSQLQRALTNRTSQSHRKYWPNAALTRLLAGR